MLFCANQYKLAQLHFIARRHFVALSSPKLKRSIENDVSLQPFEIKPAMLPLTCSMSGLCIEKRADREVKEKVGIVNDD